MKIFSVYVWVAIGIGIAISIGFCSAQLADIDTDADTDSKWLRLSCYLGVHLTGNAERYPPGRG
jgi:hypothetical protein